MARNGYRAFYRGRQMIVWADGSYEAQRKAATAFRANPREVVVMVTIRGKTPELRRAA